MRKIFHGRPHDGRGDRRVGKRIQHVQHDGIAFGNEKRRQQKRRRKRDTEDIRPIGLPDVRFCRTQRLFYDFHLFEIRRHPFDFFQRFFIVAFERQPLFHKIHGGGAHAPHAADLLFQFERARRAVQSGKLYVFLHKILLVQQERCSRLISMIFATCSSAREYKIFFPSRRDLMIRLSRNIRS